MTFSNHQMYYDYFNGRHVWPQYNSSYYNCYVKYHLHLNNLVAVPPSRVISLTQSVPIINLANMALWRPWFDEQVSVERQVTSDDVVNQAVDVDNRVVAVGNGAIDIEPQTARQVRHLNQQQLAALQSLLQYMYEMKKAAPPYEASQDWSILKTTSLLSDSATSFYDDHVQMFSSTDVGYSPVAHSFPKVIKTEPTDLLPHEMQQYTAWQSKFIDYWQPQDCLFWLIHELQELKLARALPEVKMEKLVNIDGTALKNMTLDEFRWMFPEYGAELFNRLQRIKASVNNFYSFDHWSNAPVPADDSCLTDYSTPTQESHTLTDLDEAQASPTPTPYLTQLPYQSPIEERVEVKEESIEEVSPEPPQPEKRRPGRPRGTRKKKKPEKLGRLWEFIRDLLLNPLYNPSLICWENYDEGTFRFVHSDRVAKLWGSKKDNTDMNYEKLSRAMRYYYKSQVLLPVYGKRLVYKFGPTATGWRSQRPIFRAN